MKVAVWGAGNIGSGLARRLATCPFVSRLAWINRTMQNIEKAAIDIEHGLSFAPTCTEVRPVPQERASVELKETDLLVLTLGERVPRRGTRAASLEPGAETDGSTR